MMAFYASVVNTSNGFLGEMTGAWLNKYLKVTKDNIRERYIDIFYIGLAS